MIIPVDYAQANIRFTGVGAPEGSEITMGFNIELYPDDPAALAADIIQRMNDANIEQLFTTELTVTSVLVKFGPNLTGAAAEVGFSYAGTATAPTTPPNTTVLIRKNTGFGGRAGRGRMYFPGTPEAQITGGGVVSSTWVTAHNTAWETFRVGIVGDGAVPTLLHGPGSPITTPLPITSFTAQSLAATQRRRLRP